ncbi:hypothetical protein [Arenimonas aestuarii]
MSKRPSKTVVPKAAPSRTLPVPTKPDESPSRAVARSVVRPTVLSAFSLGAFRPAGMEEVPLADLIDELCEQVQRTNSGDMARPVGMLTAQAHTLDAIFNRLAYRAASNMAEYPEATELYLKLALRAQGQCRATLEAISTIKNPPVVFAKQANIAHGHQQVNNGTAAPHAGESENAPNKLLEAEDGQWMDAPAPGTASGADPAMEAVGEVNRPKKRGRQGKD